jgi:hypothetical protein
LEDLSEDFILDCLIRNNLRLLVLEFVFSPLNLLDRWVQLPVHTNLLYLNDFRWFHLKLICCWLVDIVELHPVILNSNRLLHLSFVSLLVAAVIHLVVERIDGVAIRLLRFWSVIYFGLSCHEVFSRLLSTAFNNSELHYTIIT